jgi:hypothetical protein
MSSPASLLLPHFSLFLRTLWWRLPVVLRLLSLGLRGRLLTTLLHRPVIIALLLLGSALNGLLRNLGMLLRLSLLRRPSGLRRHLRTLLPLRFRTGLLLRLYRPRLLWWWLWWLLRRLWPRVSLLRWQTLLIPVWFSLLLLLLLWSLLSGSCLFPVRLLLMLRLRRPLLPIFLLVFLFLAEGHARSAERQGQCGIPCKVVHSLPCHFHHLALTEARGQPKALILCCNGQAFAGREVLLQRQR